MINIEEFSRTGSNVEHFKAGQIIIRDGETDCDKMYILLDGSVDIYKNYQESCELKIATLVQCDFFGEMSLFLNRERTATVVACEDTTVLAVDHTNAYSFFKDHPEATYSLIKTLCSRLVKTNTNIVDNHVKYEKNITSLNNEKQELKIAASVDPLTGIYNRRHFMATAEALHKNFEGEKDKAFVIMIDLDFFKKVNDTYGHQAGDMVLKMAANTVSHTIRPCDLFARYGGEEFILLITDADREAVTALGERLRKNISKDPVEFEGNSISVTASFGVADISYGVDITEAISLADGALYKAKEEGRNRVVFYEP